jgi:hypothetical protein
MVDELPFDAAKFFDFVEMVCDRRAELGVTDQQIVLLPDD